MSKSSLHKDDSGEDSLINAFYICILDMLRSTIITADDFKYLTIEDFLRVYKMFRDQSNKDKTLLWQTANWSFIFFNMIPAKKNIGLAKNVIPKFLEGWNGRCFAYSLQYS